MGEIKKPRLSRQLILSASMALAREQGVDSVSTRKIANRLGVTSMAIYRHFEDKEELRGEMLDEFILQADVLPRKALPWDQWLHHVSHRMFSVLCEEPGWIPLFGQVQLKPGALRVMDRCLSMLKKAGFTSHQAVKAFFVMIQTVAGASSMQAAFSRTNDQYAFPVDRFRPDDYPSVNESLPELLMVVRENTLETGMNWLVEGLQRELVADSLA